MKFRKFVFVAVFVVCLAARCALADDDNIKEKEEEPRNGAQKRLVQLPAMIDFARFKQLYDKHYPTAVVAMNRAKLFATNAYHVFISRVNYVWRKSSSFLAINKYSDMTALERHKLLDIHIGEYYHEAEEEEAGQRRKKRDVESDELDLQLRQLTAEDLMREVPELPERIARSIADGSIGIGDVLHSSGQLPAGNDSSSSGENHRRTKRVPDQVYMDLRTSGCIGPVKHQGEYCNSCYAMGVSVQYEYRFCRQTGTHATFSDQYVVDCGRQFKQTHTSRNIRDLNGCSGGHGSAVGHFYNSYGLELENDYPYIGVEGECPVPINRPERQLGRVRVSNGLLQEVRRSRIDDPTIMRLMSISGPVSVVTQVDDNFHFYGGGVQSFSCDELTFGHVLVIVGRGIEDNREYWIMRNTFGSGWGEGGYWRVATSIANCFNQVLALRDPQFAYNQQYAGL